MNLLSTDGWLALLTLSAMEIVLGIDNIVFLTILIGRLPPQRRAAIRRVGLLLALGFRLALLFALSWMMRLTVPFLFLGGKGFSGRDLILLGGGLFLIGKSSQEVYNKLEGGEDTGPHGTNSRKESSVFSVLFQIILIDLVFSLDSVITALGMAKNLSVMVVAMLISVAVMMIFARAVGDFVERHPSVKILALTFLMLIGVLLTAEGFGQHISKGYIYLAMAYALFVEMLNMRFRKKQAPVSLHRGGLASETHPPGSSAP